MDQLTEEKYGSSYIIMNYINFTGNQNVVGTIKAGRVRWLGHLF
jgi:hypothetical protein